MSDSQQPRAGFPCIDGSLALPSLAATHPISTERHHRAASIPGLKIKIEEQKRALGLAACETERSTEQLPLAPLHRNQQVPVPVPFLPSLTSSCAAQCKGSVGQGAGRGRVAAAESRDSRFVTGEAAGRWKQLKLQCNKIPLPWRGRTADRPRGESAVPEMPRHSQDKRPPSAGAEDLALHTHCSRCSPSTGQTPASPALCHGA